MAGAGGRRAGWGWLDWTVSAGPTALPSPVPVGVGADDITDTGVQPLRLKVRDKRRLDVGQQVAWVIQSDGLHLLHAPQDALVRLCAWLTQLRNLGELSLATLELEQPAGVPLQLTLAGPQRQGLAVGQRVCVGLDREWVHVMPTRSA